MKHLLLILFMICFGIKANSQAAIFALLFGDKVASENFNVSLEAGFASTTIANLEYDPSRALGMQFGIGFNIKLNDRFTLSPGAYFLSTRAVNLKDAPVYQGQSIQIVDEFSDVLLQFQYIDVPVKFYYSFPNSEWSAGLAPQVSFLTKSTAKYDFGNSEKLTAEVEDFAEKLEYGLQVFLTRNFKLNERKLMILGLRYYQGFSEVVKKETGFTDGSSTSNYFGICLSFPFIADLDQ